MKLFDGHCDTLTMCRCQGYGLRSNTGDVDLDRGGYLDGWVQFFALFADPEMERTLGKPRRDLCREELSIFRRELAKERDTLVQCRTAGEAEAALSAGKRAAFLSVEGGELLDCSLSGLEEAHGWGVRMVNPVWNTANILSGTNREEPDRGLSPEGRAFVGRMQELHMIVDVSHLSAPGFWDVAELVKGPFVASHSNARSLCPHPRNLTDGMFLELVRHGGVAGINLYRDFLGEDPDVDTAVAHIERFLALGGERNISIGGDLDGCGGLLPAGIRGIQDIGKIWDRLLQRNHSEELVQAIFFDNMMRVVNEVCTM